MAYIFPVKHLRNDKPDLLFLPFPESDISLLHHMFPNIGLPVIVCKELPDEVKTGDTMELRMSDGTAEANGKTYSCTKLPEYMQNILNQGGLIASLNKED